MPADLRVVGVQLSCLQSSAQGSRGGESVSPTAASQSLSRQENAGTELGMNLFPVWSWGSHVTSLSLSKMEARIGYFTGFM